MRVLINYKRHRLRSLEEPPIHRPRTPKNKPDVTGSSTRGRPYLLHINAQRGRHRLITARPHSRINYTRPTHRNTNRTSRGFIANSVSILIIMHLRIIGISRSSDSQVTQPLNINNCMNARYVRAPAIRSTNRPVNSYLKARLNSRHYSDRASHDTSRHSRSRMRDIGA